MSPRPRLAAPPRLLGLAALLVATLAPAAAAQTAGAWSDVFAYPGVRLVSDPSGPMRGTVQAVEPDGQGGVYVGGVFDTVDGVPASSVAHWDGSRWRVLGGGLRTSGYYASVGDVRDLLLASDGSLYATGRFSEAIQPDGRAVRANGVVRWTGAAWAPVAGGLTASGSPEYAAGYALAEGPDGALYVGGSFDGVVGATGRTVSAWGLARWAGGEWDDVGGLGLPGNTVAALDVRSDGALAVAGTVGASGYYGVVTLVAADGTRTAVLDGVQGVQAVAWSGGDLFVGGSFYAATDDGRGAQNLVRWSEGDVSSVGGGTNGLVRGLRATGDGGVFVVGAFTEVGGTETAAAVEARGVARWTGASWDGLGSVAPLDVYGGQLAVDVADTPGGLVVGGTFDGIGRPGETARSAASVAVYRGGVGWRPLSRFSGDAAVGPADSQVYYSAASVAVSASAPSPCGPGVVVAGTFGTVGGERTASVALWDGRAWQPVPGRLVYDYGYGGGAAAIAPAGCDGGRARFFVGGLFNAIDLDGTRLEAQGVAYWDGAAWSALDGAPDGEVRTLAYDGATLAAGGALQRNNQGGVFTWRAGDGWRMLGNGVDGGVSVVTYGPDGALYVGGDFATVRQPSGLPIGVGGLARWTGTTWDWIGNPAYGSVRALVFGPDGALYAGGAFDEFVQPSRPNTPARRVAVWDGTSWADAGDPGVVVSALAVGANGRIYAGAAADPYSYPAPTGESLSVFTEAGWQGLGVRGGVAALTLDETRLYVGGRFVQAGATPSAYLALYVDPLATPTAGRPGPAALAVSVAPNPARDRATLTVEVPAPGPVRAAVYDALGREVAVLWDGPRPAGPLALDLDAARLPAGAYVARVQAGGVAATRTLTVVR